MTSPFGEVFIKLLLHHGADTNSVSVDGQTPIHTAVIFGREQNLTILMRNGGNYFLIFIFLSVFEIRSSIFIELLLKM